MTIEEINKQLERTDLTKRQRTLLTDVMIEMTIANVRDSSEVDNQVLVALIQKESIS